MANLIIKNTQWIHKIDYHIEQEKEIELVRIFSTAPNNFKLSMVNLTKD